MKKIQSGYASNVSSRLSKKELFLWRTDQGYGFSVKHRADVYCQWKARKREKYFRYLLRRNAAWYRALLVPNDKSWSLRIRRCL